MFAGLLMGLWAVAAWLVSVVFAGWFCLLDFMLAVLLGSEWFGGFGYTCVI